MTDSDELAKLESKDRFRITQNGVSKRWAPGSSKTHFYANGDEHREDGTLTEDGEEITAMQDKRLRKMKTLEQAVPEPRIFGEQKNADISFVGWGSTLPLLKDLISVSGANEKLKIKNSK